MIAKTGAHGNNTETIVNMMVTTVPRGTGFLLIGIDDNDRFVGFIFAILVPSTPPWVDFIGMWTIPGIARDVKHDAFKLLKAWALAHGAKSILAGITRKPEVFFRFFHEPLGFKNIGLILEYDLTKEVFENA
jgi:hypothetical protein